VDLTTAALPLPAQAGLFPSRDQMISYLEDYAQRHVLRLRLRTRAERIDPHPRGWQVHTPAGPLTARQVIAATGHDHTPHIPRWPGLDRYAGRVLHAAGYRNAQALTAARVAVAGAGCSGLEIAYDLAQGGATRVWVCVRTQPNIMLRRSGGLPGDLSAIALLRLPPGIAARAALLVRRLTIGDLSQHGLTPPAEGIFPRLRRRGKAPAIVDQAIRTGQIQITAGIESFGPASVVLSDGTHLHADAVIAAAT
jgi:putative flavoprotein involved in K+ transport